MSLQSVDATNYDSLGYVLVSWDQTGQPGNFEAWRIYRRNLDVSGPWELIHQTNDSASPSLEHRDFLAPANWELEYALVAVTSGNVEGDYNDSAVVTSAGTNYWMISEFDESLNFRIEHVTKDDFSDEYEEATFGLIGRGRKKDVGTRWGFKGSLNASMRPRNGRSGAEQRQDLESMKLRQGEGNIYLRTPFGDVFKTSVGELSWSRLSDSGSAPWYSVTIPYEEVY